MKRNLPPAFALAFAFAALGGVTTPAWAAAQYGGSGANLAYVAAFQTAIGPAGMPHLGSMRLNIHDDSIDGTYTGMSAMPDPLNDRIVAVTGTIDRQDGHVALQIGGSMSFQGTISADDTISGTADYRGHLYDFVAERGSPGSGK
ncbi:MAG TPA: hypothetical protein VGG89_10360 [Candidatus Baltobacteraceae bacterium]|jgi:hypothetical protein